MRMDCPLGIALDHLGERALVLNNEPQVIGVDIVDVAVDIDLFRSALRFPQKADVVLQ
jgi:hypothetical protein